VLKKNADYSNIEKTFVKKVLIILIASVRFGRQDWKDEYINDL